MAEARRGRSSRAAATTKVTQVAPDRPDGAAALPPFADGVLGLLKAAGPDGVEALLAQMSQDERNAWRWHWPAWARAAQLPPAGDWRTWLILAGRGFGKTRAGAEWVRAVAERDGTARIALVAASLAEARAIMVEGESGLRNIGPPRQRPSFESSLRRLTWPSGAQAMLYSAAEPDSLRGPQHSHARGTSAEGGLRQRSPGDDRWLASRRDRRTAQFSPCISNRRTVLADRQRSDRGLGRP